MAHLKIANRDLHINSGYGWRDDPLGYRGRQFHNGLDIRANFEDFTAAKNGKVYTIFNDVGGGLILWLLYDDGTGDRWMHLSKTYVKVGQRFKAGQKVCRSGKSGANVTGPHLHYEYLLRGTDRTTHVNPLKYISIGSNTTMPTANKNQIVVQNGWGLSNVAQAAGLPMTVDTYKQIYNLNQGHRGAQNWEQLNTVMGPGDILTVKADTPKINSDTAAKLLDAQEKLKQAEEAKAQLEQDIIDKAKAFDQQRNDENARHAEELSKINEQLESYMQLAKDREIPLPNPVLTGIAIVGEVQLTDKDKDIYRAFRLNLLQRLLVLINDIFDKIPSWIRPLAYVGSGALAIAVATYLGGIDWNHVAMSLNLDESTSSIFVVIAVALANQSVFILKQTGGSLKERAYETSTQIS